MIFGNIGILGAGTMGKQLALLCSARGASVTVWNYHAKANFHKDMKRLALVEARLGRIQKEMLPEVLGRIVLVSELANLTVCDLYLEAVKEEQSIKSDALSQLSEIAKPGPIICSNTSTLSITELASTLTCPPALIGMHFFNPPILMKLVEVSRGEYTSDETLSTALNFLEYLQKTSVVLPETPGFVVNRLLFPMINEAIFLLSENVADARTIDNCMRMGANHPMGPLELADFIGLDICLSILETLVKETGDAKYRPAPLLRKYVRANRLGRKVGVGFFHYARKPE